ncbi:replication-relaxation family protein [Solibacillus sp. FSL H8-0538]|uniref:replication-relaxation family protein n=1 Tax=Solibacillus sp. FSL H8-0538 TaxID=2921400 RepID=UPI0030FA7AAA
MTRDQLNHYFELGKVRNANRVLRDLSDYIACMREGYQSIYYLSKLGRGYVECTKIRKKGGHVQHTVLRNEFWLFSNCPPDWRNEVKISDGKTHVVTDAMYTKSLQHHFLEVDRLQPMKENRAKIARYEELASNGLIEAKLGYFPTIVWLTTTELRRQQLKELCGELRVVKVYTLDDIK